VSHKVSTLVDYRDIHWLANFGSLLFTSRDDSPCITQCHKNDLPDYRNNMADAGIEPAIPMPAIPKGRSYPVPAS
jgi:hypothetical protein